MNFISLKEYSTVNSMLSISVTNKAFDLLEKHCKGGYKNFLAQFSGAKTLLIARETYNDGNCNYHISFNGLWLSCKESIDKRTDRIKGLLIISLKPEDFSSQNIAMSKGLFFSLKKGSCITIRYTDRNIYEEFVDGTHFLDTGHSDFNYESAITTIIKTFDAMEKSGGIAAETAEEYAPTEELDEMLDLAENYANITSMIAESKVRADDGLTYTEIRSVDYKRNDRIAYRFIVTKFKEDTFDAGTQVELKDVFDNPISAEVIAYGKEDSGECYIDLLFNKQININSIESFGSIRLSFSTVIKDVQQGAIEAIRNNEAPAKYMDDILGTHTPRGFENINLSELEEYFKDENKTNYDYINSFPPNPSQADAIIKGIKSKDAFFVMGPPGTGKTTVILEWVKYFVLKKHMRVLISSQKHKAVDNVIERIIDEEGIDVLRIGSETKMQENVKECMFENKIYALRQKITQSTDNNIEQLKAQISLWQSRLVKMNALKPLLKDIERKAAVLEKEIGKNLLPKYKELTNAVDNIRSIKDKIKKIYEKIKKQAAYETKKNNAENLVVRCFFAVVFFFCRFLLKSNARKILKLQEKEKNAISEYYVCRERYQNAYNNIANGAFLPYYEAYLKYKQQAETVLCDTDNNESVMFKFNVDIASFKKVEQLDNFNVAVDLEIKKAVETIDIISSWSNDISSEQTYALEKMVLESVNLVGATCIGISSQKRFSDLSFDVTIIDEAGQIQIHDALVPMSLSNKLIMLGDHKQIPPSADEKVVAACDERGIDSTLLEKSLFECLYDKMPNSNKRMLDTQFRMPADIADIISEWFYEGAYKSHVSKRNLTSLIPAVSQKPFIIIDTSDSKNRIETDVKNGEQTFHYNKLEAEIIVDIVKYLAANGFDLSQVGVIAALKMQVSYIKNMLIKAGFDNTTVNETVATLDSFQGHERKIILYSFTRSSNKPSELNRVGFLTELRRINVAMSRCKQTMVMIGDMTFLSSCESVVDYRGEQAEDDRTEKNFSEFIRKVVSDIKDKDRGEIISFAEFKNRINAAQPETEG